MKKITCYNLFGMLISKKKIVYQLFPFLDDFSQIILFFKHHHSYCDRLLVGQEESLSVLNNSQKQFCRDLFRFIHLFVYFD